MGKLLTKYAIVLVTVWTCYGVALSYAQESSPKFQERTNNETERRLLRIEGGISLTTQVSGILPLANGGLGVDLSSLSQGDILYFDGSTITKLVAGTSGQFLKTLGAGANPAWSDNKTISLYEDGTLVEMLATTERNSGNVQVYTKIKELSPLVRGGVITVSWDFRVHQAGWDAHTKLYINDIAIGTQKTTTSATDVAASETGITVIAGDIIQIWGWVEAPSGTNTYVNDLSILCLNPVIAQEGQ